MAWTRMIAASMASVSAVALATISHAETTNMEAAPVDTAESRGLEEIIVTAQKRSQSLQDVPISVSVADAEALARSNVQAVSDLPALAPSLTFTGGAQPAFRTLTIRGIGSYVYRIGVQPAVSTVVDGVPLARTSEGSAELGDVERVEVLNGPQGTLFGRNSTGGIVNVVRAAPSPEFGGYVDGQLVQGEQGDTQTLIRGAVNLPITNGIRARLFGYNQANSPFIKNLHPTAQDSGRNHTWGLQAKLAVDVTPDVDLLFSADYLNDDNVGGTPEILVPLQPYQVPAIQGVTAKEIAMQTPAAIGHPFVLNTYLPYTSTEEFVGVTGQLNARLSDALQFRSVTAYRDNKITGQSPSNAFAANARDPQGWYALGGLPSTFIPQGGSRYTKWHYFTQEARLEYSQPIVDAVAGVYYFNLFEKELSSNPTEVSAESLRLATGAATPPGTPPAPGTATGPSTSYPYYFNDNYTIASDKNRVFAGFIDVTLHPMEGLDLFAGYRLSRETLKFDYFRERYTNLPIRFGTNFNAVTYLPTVRGTVTTFSGSKTETHYSARAGASYEFTPNMRGYFTYGHGYVGSGVDLGNGSTGTAANPNAALLRPSVTDNYEVGLKSELFDRRLRLNVTLFKTKTRDVQVTALLPQTNINVVQNAGDIDAKGVEVNLQAQLSDALDVSAGFAYLDAVFRNLFQPCYPNQRVEENNAGRCQPITPGATTFNQSVAGTPGLNAPKYKLNVSATYTIDDVFAGWNMYLRPELRYQSKVYYQLDHDPFATQRGFEIVNFTLGFTSQNDKYEARLFVNNITDQYYCPNATNQSTARRACLSSPIDGQRRFGAAFKVGF